MNRQQIKSNLGSDNKRKMAPQRQTKEINCHKHNYKKIKRSPNKNYNSNNNSRNNNHGSNKK